MRFGEEFHYVKKHKPKGRSPLAEWPVMPTIIALSCSQPHVQAAIDSAVDGDVVGIPAGSCTWTDAVIFIDKEITVTGQGIGITNITSNQQFLFFVHITDPTKGHFRLCHFTVLGDVAEVLKVSSNSMSAVPSGMWRVDHIHFNFAESLVDHGGIHQVGVNYGLIDNCIVDWKEGGIFLRHIFGLQSETPSRGISITRSGSVATATADSSISDWATGDSVHIEGVDQAEYNGTFTITVTGPNTFTFPVTGAPATPATPPVVSVVNASRKVVWPGNFASTIGTGLGGSNFTFVEDCVFRTRRNNFTDVYDASAGGGRVVWRHNSMSGCCRFYNHWTRGTEVAAQVMEIYNNTWIYDPGLSPFDPGHVFRIEGGTGVFFNNYSNYNNGAPFVILDDRRSGGFGGPVTEEATPGRTWELCDGTHPWDGNAGDPGAPGWPGLFQIGTGSTAMTSFVKLSAGEAEQPNIPFYMWHNGVQATCAIDGGACTNSIFAFTAPAAYIRSSASPHPDGRYDYREDNTPLAGYSPYPYPHPLRSAEVRGAGSLVTGPQSGSTQPAGSIAIAAGSTTASRQALIDSNPEGTVFWLQAGTHTANGVNTPKTGNIFVGEAGAVIDGTGWVSGTDTDAVFGGTSSTARNVVFRNLTIRNLPQRGIQAYPWYSATGWVVEYCEIHNCGEAIVPGNDAIVRNNKLHDCYRTGHPSLTGACVLGGGNMQVPPTIPQPLSNILFLENEMYNFGQHQKMLDACNMVWRRNYIHHADGPAIWNDGYGDGFLAENNTIEDCGRGIHWELSFGGTIRLNIIRRSADQAVYVSTSRDTAIYRNTFEDNFRAIAYFVNCASIGQFWWDTDTRNNVAYDNIIRVPNVANVLANFFSYAGVCDVSAYLNNSKNNNFVQNTYQVPSLSGFYWLWGGGLLNWSTWQALPQDAAGTIQLV